MLRGLSAPSLPRADVVGAGATDDDANTPPGADEAFGVSFISISIFLANALWQKPAKCELYQLKPEVCYTNSARRSAATNRFLPKDQCLRDCIGCKGLVCGGGLTSWACTNSKSLLPLASNSGPFFGKLLLEPLNQPMAVSGLFAESSSAVRYTARVMHEHLERWDCSERCRIVCIYVYSFWH
jgi:hypothetical protein